MSKENGLQFTLHSGGYIRCGSTTPSIPAGSYTVEELGFSGWGLTPKATVSDELIDIPGTIADEIFGDIDRFLDSKSRYEAYSLTHKRGYLFWGPPGSGKTSLGLMLSDRFIKKVGGVVMFVASPSELYEGVSIMRDVEPGRPTMYLIEEADNIINSTYCLSILDGELSIQGAVFVAMTNYKGKLPPRISNRPGRFDRVEMVNSPPEAVQIEYLRRVEARVGGRPEVVPQIVESLSGLSVSLAHLREAFISHVLMGVPLATVRKRFAAMADQPDDTMDGLLSKIAPQEDTAKDED